MCLRMYPSSNPILATATSHMKASGSLYANSASWRMCRACVPLSGRSASARSRMRLVSVTPAPS